MIPALSLILACQLSGEILSRALMLPLPGPVLGMIFLLVLMSVSEKIREVIRPAALFILQHLSLLFVPAGVGVVAHLDGSLSSDTALRTSSVQVARSSYLFCSSCSS
jgi:putative effector of murein hydrolase LrgA (UPF0299 family)